MHSVQTTRLQIEYVLLLFSVEGQIQDLVKGGPKFFRLIFASSAQRSCINEVSPYWPGSRAHLRAPEALGFFITKYAFSPF